MGDIPIAPSHMVVSCAYDAAVFSPSASQQTQEIGTGAAPVFDVIQEWVIP